MKDKIILVVLIASLSGAAAIWFFATHEQVEIEERTAPAAEVRTNRYFGFVRYLLTHNIDSENIYNLNTRSQLPEPADTIWFDAETSTITTQETDDILNWVAAGGQLILRSPVFQQNRLLVALGIDDNVALDGEWGPSPTGEKPVADEPVESGVTPGSDEPRDAGHHEPELTEHSAIPGDAETAQPAATGNSDIPGDVAPAQPVYQIHHGEIFLGELEYPALFPRPKVIERPLTWSMSIAQTMAPDPEPKVFAFGFRYGLGFVTVLDEYRQLDNEHFYLRDNSFIMLKALTLSRMPGKVWIVRAVTRPGLWSLLWWRSAHLILWGALGIVFFFWWAGQRFGRLLPDPPAVRREFYEHIAASGRFLWRTGQHDALLHRTRDSLMQKINKRYPHFRDAGASLQRYQLETILGKDIALWDVAMTDHNDRSKQQFVEKIKALQELWKII